jgi:hypothetical protein
MDRAKRAGMSEPFLVRLRACPNVHDRSRAERVLEALGGSGSDDPWLRLLRATASNSPYLSRAIERDPRWVDQLRNEVPEDVIEAQLARLEGACELPRADALQLLRDVKYRCLLHWPTLAACGRLTMLRAT